MVGMKDNASVEAMAQELQEKAADLWGQERAEPDGACDEAGCGVPADGGEQPAEAGGGACVLFGAVVPSTWDPRTIARR